MKDEAGKTKQFTVRAAIVLCLAVGAAIALYLLLHLAQALLLVFAGVLLAVALDGTASWIRRRTRLPRGLSLTLLGLVLTILLAASVWLVGPHIADQASRLEASIPEAVERVRSSVMEVDWLRSILDSVPSVQDLVSSGSGIMGRITGVFSSALGVLVSGLFILFVGVFVALDPDLYIDGFMHLVPGDRRPRAREVLSKLGAALRWWLLGRLASMIVVGILTVAGLLIVGLPLALILGLLAAVLSFVPLVGPVLSAVPAVLIGFVEGPLQAVYVVMVYMAVQALEGNIITPVIQRQAVYLPPAVLIVAQLLMAVVFGWMGVFLSTPLAVAVILVIQMVYVEDVIGDDIELLGEHG